MRYLLLSARGRAAAAMCTLVAAAAAGSFCPTVACAKPPSTIGAATKPAPLPPLPVLQIGPLNNKGGAETEDPDGTPLCTGFVRALTFALKAEYKSAHFRLWWKPATPSLNRNPLILWSLRLSPPSLCRRQHCLLLTRVFVWTANFRFPDRTGRICACFGSTTPPIRTRLSRSGRGWPKPCAT